MANLNEFAATLSQIAKRDRPWTGKFLHSLLKGYPGFMANEKLLEALKVLRRRVSGAAEITAQATESTVLAVYRLPAQTIILGQPQQCATPGCYLWFVPTHPRQKYHSKTCARQGRQPGKI